MGTGEGAEGENENFLAVHDTIEEFRSRRNIYILKEEGGTGIARKPVLRWRGNS